MVKTRWWIATALLLVVAGMSALGQETTQTESLNVQLDGRKTWTVRYGFGSPLALAGASIGAGQLTLDQTLAVDFTATALSIFRVKGHFNDQEPADMQSLSLYLDTENVQGVAGDFTAPNLGSFFAGSRTMKGARVDVLWDGGSAVGIASQLSGVRDSRQFVGETAFGERTFAGHLPDAGVSYTSSLDGYGYADLQNLYVAGFTEIRLQLEDTGLAAILAQYGVSELGAALASFQGRVVDADEAIVVGTEVQSLVLKFEPANLIRETVREAIRVYNKSGAGDPVSYPFVVGSDVEGEFLDALEPHAVLVVGTEEHPLGELRWRRFYDLGQENVQPDSVLAAVRVEDEFVPTNDPQLAGYATLVHAAEGILEVAFPDSFFVDPQAALRVSFGYAVTGGTYVLGAAVIPDSERVTLAGRVLTKDEYTIDYEFGILVLNIQIGPNDPLVVEFERYSGLGGSGAYARAFYGATASIPISKELSLTGYALRGADERASVTHPESVRIMPNTQTVVGVSGTVTRSDLSADFDIGYTNDAFPYDDNARQRTPNRVNALGTSNGMAFAGTDAGFSAMTDGTWRTYDAGSGLSGREVRAIAADADRAYFGTEGGLTLVRLTGVSSLDKVANWSRYAERDGLLDVSVRALLLDGEDLWIGTDGGLFRVAVADLGNKDAWTAFRGALLVDIRALCIEEGTLYVGTADGLVRVDRTTGAATPVDVAGSSIVDLPSDGVTLYAAGEDGLRTFVGGVATGWLVEGEAVDSVEAVGGDVFYGSSVGLTRLSDGEVTHVGWTVTALHADGDALWIGTAGDGAGELFVWDRAATEAAYDAATTKIDPWNPRVYSDSAAGDHTTTGWTAQGSFAHEGDGYSITGSVDRVLPGFRAIDARGRTNAGGWSIASDIDLGPEATLSFDHAYRMSDIGSEDARTTTDNRLTFRGSFGPQITLSLGYKAEDASEALRGFERNGLSYSLSVDHKLFEDALSLSINWDEGLHWDDGRPLRRETSLSTQATVKVLPDLTTSISWRRPVRIIGETTSGSERWDWKTDGTFDVAGFGVAATYELDSSRSLPEGAAALVHKGTLGLSTAAFEFGGWSLAPTFDLEADHEQGATGLSGRLGVRVGVGDLTTRTTASVDVSGLGTRVLRWSEKLASSVTYTGIEGLRPSLNYSGVRSLTEVEGQGSKASMTHSLNGSLTWSGENGASETLRLTARLQDSGFASVTIDNAFSRDVTSALAGWIPALKGAQASGAPTVFLRTDASGEWRRQAERDDASWHIGATGDVALSSTWSLSLGLAYYGGVKTDITMFHGLVAELTVAIDFQK